MSHHRFPIRPKSFRWWSFRWWAWRLSEPLVIQHAQFARSTTLMKNLEHAYARWLEKEPK